MPRVFSNPPAFLSLPGAAFLATTLPALAGCGAPPPSAPGPPQPAPAAVAAARSGAPLAVRHLLLLMRDRLAVMHDVARTKWNANRPVADPGRERALLKQMEEQGQKHGLAPSVTRAFFTAQMAAARRVQEADLARWRAEKRGPFPDAPDLAALRRRIDGLNRQLLAVLAEARPALGRAGGREQVRAWAQEVLTGDGITEDVRAQAVEALTPAP